MKTTDVTGAIKAFAEAMKGNTATPAEVQRRLKICSTCPKRRNVSGMTGRISQLMGFLTNKHLVSEEFSGQSCSVCGCSFLLLLPAAPENLHKDSPREKARRPRRCWMNSP